MTVVRTVPAGDDGGGIAFAVRAFNEYAPEKVFWEPHSHATHELLWNEGGASTVIVGDVTYTITDGWGMWIPAGMLHSGFTTKDTACCSAHFDVAVAPRLAEGCTAVEITPLLAQLLDRVRSAELSAASRTLTETMIIDVLCPADTELSFCTPDLELLRPIVEAATSDPAHSLSLGQWATRLGVSTKTITRAFRRETGRSFSQWAAAVRAQHAIMMLAQGHLVEDVARATGYSTGSGFGAAFRKVTGCTPGSFRRDVPLRCTLSESR
jgi:AraC-type DNA-binding domain-containing proteins